MSLSRRSFFTLTSGLSVLGLTTFATRSWGQAAPPLPYAIAGADAFPQQDPSLVKDAVAASHGNFARIRELVEKQPAMARASIDWGYGDWETCIDAAAHVGNKPIADFLLTYGARPTLFSAAMMGQLDVVKAMVAARPGIQRTLGPHGITLMSHAKAGGADAAAVVQFLASLGDADTPAPTQPLAPADRDALVGKYVYGAGPRDFFMVDVLRDVLGIDRPNSPARRLLLHTGNLTFFPSGVPTAKIAFLRDGGKVTQLTLADPNVMLTAKRT
ncbi:MAG: hypothetical protein RLZZ53_1240 [Acidobacteriota bacterium]|jgi:hypothetical protein